MCYKITSTNVKLLNMEGVCRDGHIKIADTVEPVYYGHLGTNHKCHDYQGVLIFQVSLYDKAAPFGTIIKCVNYAVVLVFKCPD